MRKIRKLLFIAGVLALGYLVYYCWISFPIATGYGAKVLCSGIYLSGRNADDIINDDLDFFPVNMVRYDVNHWDSSVSTSILGLAKKKAIFRKGLGSTLVNGITEQELRTQHFVLPEIVHENAETLPWPKGDLLNNDRSFNIEQQKLSVAVNKVFSDTIGMKNETRALIVIYQGEIIVERYGDGFNRSTRLAGWSMSKSVMGALAGILSQEKKLKIDEPAPVPEWQEAHDPRRSITIKNLLQQTSGLDFEEVYHKSSHANRMLFQHGNAAAYAASQRLIHAPGSFFSYSSGNSNILSRVFRSVLGEEEYHLYPYNYLFRRIGMNSAVLEPDASGTFIGSSFCYATARDWARFGLLYLNNGKFLNEQILPDGWAQKSIQPTSAARRGEYGFQWWLNRGADNDTNNRIYPGLPREMYFADGYEGQNIFIIPSKKIVVVRLGLTRAGRWGEEEFIPSLLNAIQ